MKNDYDSTNETGEINKESKLSLEERLVEYMNERYDDTFYYNGQNIYASKGQIFVRSDKFSAGDDYIMVGYSKVDGEEVFFDNYLHFKYREEIIALLQETLADAVDYDFKLFYGGEPGAGINTILPADTTFEEYISTWISDINFTAVMAPGYDIGDKDALVKRLKDTFATNNMIIASATLRFCDDLETYESLNRETLGGFLFSYNRDDNGKINIRRPTLYMTGIGKEKEYIEWR